eukprot:1140444-Pelagomonas_calceolata.AAC.1
MQAVKALPTSIKEMMIPRAKVLGGLLAVTMPDLGDECERSLLKSASGANEFISILERMSMKLQSKLDGCMGINTKLFKRLQSVRGIDAPAHT